MRLSYHPATQRDVNEILDFYRTEGGNALADRFYSDLMARLDDVVARPERFAPNLGHAIFRRARLRRFPHVIVFRILRDCIRVNCDQARETPSSFWNGAQVRQSGHTEGGAELSLLDSSKALHLDEPRAMHPFVPPIHRR